MKYLQNHFRTLRYDYNKAVDVLKKADLYNDDGHRYGSAWIREEVPEDIIKYLFSLPAISGDSWSDVNKQEVDEHEFFDVIFKKG